MDSFKPESLERLDAFVRYQQEHFETLIQWWTFAVPILCLAIFVASIWLWTFFSKASVASGRASYSLPMVMNVFFCFVLIGWFQGCANYMGNSDFRAGPTNVGEYLDIKNAIRESVYIGETRSIVGSAGPSSVKFEPMGIASIVDGKCRVSSLSFPAIRFEVEVSASRAASGSNIVTELRFHQPGCVLVRVNDVNDSPKAYVYTVGGAGSFAALVRKAALEAVEANPSMTSMNVPAAFDSLKTGLPNELEASLSLESNIVGGKIYRIELGDNIAYVTEASGSTLNNERMAFVTEKTFSNREARVAIAPDRPSAAAIDYFNRRMTAIVGDSGGGEENESIEDDSLWEKYLGSTKYLILTGWSRSERILAWIRNWSVSSVGTPWSLPMAMEEGDEPAKTLTFFDGVPRDLVSPYLAHLGSWQADNQNHPQWGQAFVLNSSSWSNPTYTMSESNGSANEPRAKQFLFEAPGEASGDPHSQFLSFLRKGLHFGLEIGPLIVQGDRFNISFNRVNSSDPQTKEAIRTVPPIDSQGARTTQTYRSLMFFPSAEEAMAFKNKFIEEWMNEVLELPMDSSRSQKEMKLKQKLSAAIASVGLEAWQKMAILSQGDSKESLDPELAEKVPDREEFYHRIVKEESWPVGDEGRVVKNAFSFFGEPNELIRVMPTADGGAKVYFLVEETLNPNLPNWVNPIRIQPFDLYWFLLVRKHDSKAFKESQSVSLRFRNATAYKAEGRTLIVDYPTQEGLKQIHQFIQRIHSQISWSEDTSPGPALYHNSSQPSPEILDQKVSSTNLGALIRTPLPEVSLNADEWVSGEYRRNPNVYAVVKKSIRSEPLQCNLECGSDPSCPTYPDCCSVTTPVTRKQFFEFDLNNPDPNNPDPFAAGGFALSCPVDGGGNPVSDLGVDGCHVSRSYYESPSYQMQALKVYEEKRYDLSDAMLDYHPSQEPDSPSLKSIWQVRRSEFDQLIEDGEVAADYGRILFTLLNLWNSSLEDRSAFFMGSVSRVEIVNSNNLVDKAPAFTARLFGGLRQGFYVTQPKAGDWIAGRNRDDGDFYVKGYEIDLAIWQYVWQAWGWSPQGSHDIAVSARLRTAMILGRDFDETIQESFEFEKGIPHRRYSTGGVRRSQIIRIPNVNPVLFAMIDIFPQPVEHYDYFHLSQNDFLYKGDAGFGDPDDPFAQPSWIVNPPDSSQGVRSGQIQLCVRSKVDGAPQPSCGAFTGIPQFTAIKLPNDKMLNEGREAKNLSRPSSKDLLKNREWFREAEAYLRAEFSHSGTEDESWFEVCSLDPNGGSDDGWGGWGGWGGPGSGAWGGDAWSGGNGAWPDHSYCPPAECPAGWPIIIFPNPIDPSNENSYRSFCACCASDTNPLCTQSETINDSGSTSDVSGDEFADACANHGGACAAVFGSTGPDGQPPCSTDTQGNQNICLCPNPEVFLPATGDGIPIFDEIYPFAPDSGHCTGCGESRCGEAEIPIPVACPEQGNFPPGVFECEPSFNPNAESQPTCFKCCDYEPGSGFNGFECSPSGCMNDGDCNGQNSDWDSSNPGVQPWTCGDESFFCHKEEGQTFGLCKTNKQIACENTGGRYDCNEGCLCGVPPAREPNLEGIPPWPQQSETCGCADGLDCGLDNNENSDPSDDVRCCGAMTDCGSLNHCAENSECPLGEICTNGRCTQTVSCTRFRCGGASAGPRVPNRVCSQPSGNGGGSPSGPGGGIGGP